jgi:acetyl esterase/lipase
LIFSTAKSRLARRTAMVMDHHMKPILLMSIAAVSLASADFLPLWPGEAPGAKRPPAGTETMGEGGRLANVEVPQYQVYLPEEGKATGGAVVIFPGGGYTILAMNHEGHDYAKWLAERGIVALVVKYRVSGNDALGYQFPVPFLDARRAIRTVRANAAKWGVDPKKVGVMGSSAGGHLASLCTTRFADALPEESGDAVDQLDCRPDFSILIYPVISMDAPFSHGGSRRRLLGENPTPELLARCSTDRAVTKDTPPVFLLSTSDDGVDCRNSLQFATACKSFGVPATLHLFEKGGHGYGMQGKGALQLWPTLLDAWLRERGVIP